MISVGRGGGYNRLREEQISPERLSSADRRSSCRRGRPCRSSSLATCAHKRVAARTQSRASRAARQWRERMRKAKEAGTRSARGVGAVSDSTPSHPGTAPPTTNSLVNSRSACARVGQIARLSGRTGIAWRGGEIRAGRQSVGAPDTGSGHARGAAAAPRHPHSPWDPGAWGSRAGRRDRHGKD